MQEEEAEFLILFQREPVRPVYSNFKKTLAIIVILC